MKPSWAFVGISNLWKKTTGECSRIYVLDSGCPTHSDLNPQIINLFNTPLDTNGHATHICGIIHQIAPQCEIVPIKITDVVPDLDLIKIALKKIINLATSNRYDIVNMSMSFSSYDKTIHKLIKKLHDLNIPVVCASGNRIGEVPWYPAKLDETISIASYGPNLTVSKFSSRDKTTDFCAPGENIESMTIGGGYVSMSGTSQACPYVAGVLALFLSLNRRKFNIPTIINHLNKTGFEIDSGMLAICPENILKTSVSIVDNTKIPWYISIINTFKKGNTNENTTIV